MIPNTISAYQMSSKEKQEYLLAVLRERHNYHIRHCSEYRNMIDKIPFGKTYAHLSEYPYLPVGLFKELELRSIPKDQVLKTLMSSGTTSQQVSKIFLDRETSANQSRALVHIVTDWIGKKRLPMVIVDHRNVLKDRTSFNARGAGIVGFSQFGRDHFYLLNDQMDADWQGLQEYLQKYQDESILLFGFTYMIWQHLYQDAVAKGAHVDLSKAIVIHGGGWKKLLEQAVDNAEFRSSLKQQFSIDRVHNYYGMVEQVGSIFMECEHGCLHTPDYADVIIRDQHTLEPVSAGQEGLIQVVSILPGSYPGNSILTEDLGTVLGTDDCLCGRKGTYFQVSGRLPSAELRGCSDTYAYGSEEMTEWQKG